MKRITASALVVLAAIAAQGQIVKPWWSQIVHTSDITTNCTTQVGFVRTLPSGAFAVGQSFTTGSRSYDANVLGLYRNGASYFTKSILPSDGAEILYGATQDRFGNLFTVTRNTSGIVIQKSASNGTVTWTTEQGLPSCQQGSMATDHEGNLYAHVIVNSYHWVMKFSGTNGQHQWTYAQNSVAQMPSAVMAAGKGDRVFLVGALPNADPLFSGVRHTMISKLGVAMGFGGPMNFPGAQRVNAAVDHEGSLVVSFTQMQGAINKPVVYKQAMTAEATSWIRTLNVLGDHMVTAKMALDPSGNVSIAGFSKLTGVVHPALARISAAGSVQFAIEIPVSQGHEWTEDLVVDRFGEAYIASMRQLNGSDLTKVSTAGTVRWTQNLATGDRTHNSPKLAIFDRSGDILVATMAFYSATSNDLGLFAIQQAPVAIADGFNIAKNMTYSSPRPVVDNDRFPLGANLTLVTNTQNGTLHLSHTGNFTYTPNAGFVGTDTFTYRLVRPGLNPSQATVQLHVK